MPGIKGLWSLRATESSAFDKYLVQSYIGETRVLSIEGEEMGEVRQQHILFNLYLQQCSDLCLLILYLLFLPFLISYSLCLPYSHLLSLSFPHI